MVLMKCRRQWWLMNIRSMRHRVCMRYQPRAYAAPPVYAYAGPGWRGGWDYRRHFRGGW